jgi:hypothetical protein
LQAMVCTKLPLICRYSTTRWLGCINTLFPHAVETSAPICQARIHKPPVAPMAIHCSQATEYCTLIPLQMHCYRNSIISIVVSIMSPVLWCLWPYGEHPPPQLGCLRRAWGWVASAPSSWWHNLAEWTDGRRLPQSYEHPDDPSITTSPLC